MIDPACRDRVTRESRVTRLGVRRQGRQPPLVAETRHALSLEILRPMSSLHLAEEPDASEADRTAVRKGLSDFNHRHMPRSDPVSLTLLLRDESGTVHGGLLATTRWHWLVIETVWVSDDYRGRGHGFRLLERAEVLARSRGCRRSALETTDFQSRSFYERAGYRVCGELGDYPPGSRTYWMEKELAGGTGSETTCGEA
jgi:GNAT superfamily N-acetyltransferase